MKLKLAAWRSLKTRVTLLMLAIFIASIWALSFFTGRMLQEDMQRVLGEQQFNAVSLGASQVSQQLVDRMGALQRYTTGRMNPAMLGDAPAMQERLRTSPTIQALFNGGVWVSRRDGIVIASTLPALIGTNYADREYMVGVLKEGRSTISKPIIGKVLRDPIIVMAVPIHDAQGQVIGALAGVTDLGQANFMDILTASRYGKTGGYFLVDLKHRLVIAASDKVRVMQALPAPGVNRVIDSFVQGYEGHGVMVNSAGVEVLASSKRIPIADWAVSASLPTAEAFEPIRRMQLRTLLAAFLLTLMAGGLTWWVLKRQLAPLIATADAMVALSGRNQIPQPLRVLDQDEIGQLAGGFNRLVETWTQREGALAESEERWKFAVEGVGDGLFDWNVQTGVVFYSQRFKQVLGFADEDEFGNTTDEWSKRIHPDDADAARAAVQPHWDGRVPFASVELRMQRKEGSWMWALVRGMVVSRDEQGRALRVIGTLSDISGRRQSEAVDQFLALTSGGPTSEPFFAALARFLAEILQMDYICIDRLEGDGLNATTLAVWHNGQFEANLTYALRDTPCGDVVGQKVCCFPANVCQLFPDDAALQQLQAESYIGVTLWSHTGQPIGLIAVIGRRRLYNRFHAEATLGRVAVRAAGELERLDAEAALQESEDRLRTVVESTREAIAVLQDERIVFVNRSAVEMIGASSAAQLLGKSMQDLVHPDARKEVMARVTSQGERGRVLPFIEERLVRLDQRAIDVEVQATPILYQGKAAIQVAMRDVTQRRQAQAKLQLAASVFEHAREGIMITDPDGSIIDLNVAFTRITGYTREDALGKNPRILGSGRHDADYFAAMWRSLVEQGYWYGEIWNRRKSGELYAEMQTISAVLDAAGKVQHYVSLFSDITAIKEHQSQLEHIAHFDALTHLPNRVLLADRLQQAMLQVQRRGQQLTVAYLDLDGFKAINDTHGHEVGDQVLVALARGMKQTLREGDTLARIGGDEFVAVLIDLENVSASMPMLTRLLKVAAGPVLLGDLVLQVSASVGVTFYPQALEIDADQLVRQADHAMYQAKTAGKNRYHVFDAEHDSSLRVRQESLARIGLALERREFVLHYQPKVNLRSGKVIGAEALIRWRHPERGLLAPATFLPVIEDHSLAVSVGEWVIETALTQVELWRRAGLDLSVSVNVGGRQLRQVDFVQRLRAQLAAHPKLGPGCLELEVLEISALADIEQASRVVEACADIGVMFALDDFGTGSSSLAYLKRLRVGMLKIDQSFIRDMLDNQEDLAILQGVIGLAAAFRRQVIAEGVESAAHGTMLLQMGCELAQGYGIARPMSAELLPGWVAAWHANPLWGGDAAQRTDR